MIAGLRFILGPAYILSPGIEPVRAQWREDRDEPCISPGYNNKDSSHSSLKIKTATSSVLPFKTGGRDEVTYTT